MKKGTVDFLVILIITIVITSIAGTILFKMYGTSKIYINDFNEFIELIAQSEDDNIQRTYLQLPEDWILVSFTNGQDFKKFYSNPIEISLGCNYNIKVPESCGNYPCICMCSGSYEYGYEDACIDGLKSCKVYTEEVTSFTDISCPSGFFVKGTDSGLTSVYFKKDDSIIRFCNSEECVSEEHQLVAEGFTKFLDLYNTCLISSQDDCTCPLDLSFLTESYSINFYKDKVDLYDRSNKNIITSTVLESSPAVYGSSKFTDVIAVYLLESSYVMSSSLEFSDPLTVEHYLYKKDNIVYLTSEELNDKQVCNAEDKLFV